MARDRTGRGGATQGEPRSNFARVSLSGSVAKSFPAGPRSRPWSRHCARHARPAAAKLPLPAEVARRAGTGRVEWMGRGGQGQPGPAAAVIQPRHWPGRGPGRACTMVPWSRPPAWPGSMAACWRPGGSRLTLTLASEPCDITASATHAARAGEGSRPAPPRESGSSAIDHCRGQRH